MTKIDDIVKSKKSYAFFKDSDYGADFHRLYSGVFVLDYCTAGIPVGVTTAFWGAPSSGKSTCATKLLASAQNTCWNCFEFLWDCKCGSQIKKKSVLVSNEGFDMKRAAELGCDTTELIVAEPSTGEEAVDIIYECLNADDCGLLVLDSFTRVVPEAEITDPALTNHMGKRAQLHTKLMNKVKSTLVANKRKNVNSCFLAINQMRARMAGGYGPTEEMSGGFASKHDWHLSCRLGSLSVESKFIDADTELPQYSRHSLNLVSPGGKRKVFTNAGKGEFLMALQNTTECLMGNSYDYKTVLEFALRYNLLDKKEWHLQTDDISYGTKTALLKSWHEDPQHYMTTKRRIVEHASKVKRGLIAKPVIETESVSAEDQS